MKYQHISLGPSCTCTHFILKNYERDAAYPFDWIISNPKDMVYHIQTRFVHWLEEPEHRYFKDGLIKYHDYGGIYDTIPTHKRARGIIFTPKDKFFFAHDLLSLNWDEAIKTIREKYQRRIDRFLNIPPDTFRYVYWDQCTWVHQLRTRWSYQKNRIFQNLDPERYQFSDEILALEPHDWKPALEKELNELWGEDRWKYQEIME